MGRRAGTPWARALGVVALIGIAAAALAPGAEAQGTWSEVAPMPTARMALAAGVVDGKLYAVGGFVSVGSVGRMTSTTEMYDPSTSAWKTMAPMPTARRNMAVGVMGGKLYAVGGDSDEEHSLDTVEVYDPATNTWARVAPMPTARSNLAAGVVGGKLYAVGGFNMYSGSMHDFEVYDPATDTWEKISVPGYPTERGYLAVGVVGGELYAVGGYLDRKNGGDRESLDLVQMYDPARNTWVGVASMTTARYRLVAGVVDGKLYALGGEDDDGNLLSTVEVYDPAGNTWATGAPMPTARSGLAAGVVDGKLYALGGYAQGNYLDTVEVYDPATRTWAAVAPMPTIRRGLAAGAVDGVLYALGGTNGGRDNIDTVEAYNPAKDTSPPPPKPDSGAAPVAAGAAVALACLLGLLL